MVRCPRNAELSSDTILQLDGFVQRTISRGVSALARTLPLRHAVRAFPFAEKLAGFRKTVNGRGWTFDPQTASAPRVRWCRARRRPTTYSRSWWVSKNSTAPYIWSRTCRQFLLNPGNRRDKALAAERMLDELLAAFRAKVEAKLLAYVFADRFVHHVVVPLDDVLNLFERIVVLVFRGRVHRGEDFHFHHVAQIVSGNRDLACTDRTNIESLIHSFLRLALERETDIRLDGNGSPITSS